MSYGLVNGCVQAACDVFVRDGKAETARSQLGKRGEQDRDSGQRSPGVRTRGDGMNSVLMTINSTAGGAHQEPRLSRPSPGMDHLVTEGPHVWLQSSEQLQRGSSSVEKP